MKILKSEEGYSLIETAIVMMLLLLFSLGIFILASTTSTTYEKLVEDKNNTEEVRIATSYLITKFRQNDRMDAVSIDYKSMDASDAIVITEVFSDEVYDTWIYVDNGTLRELTLLKGTAINKEMSFEVAKIDAFKISVDAKTLKLSLAKGDQAVSDVAITLKSKIGIVK